MSLTKSCYIHKTEHYAVIKKMFFKIKIIHSLYIAGCVYVCGCM